MNNMDLYRTCKNGQVILSELWKDNHPDCDDQSDVLPLLVRKMLAKGAGKEMVMGVKSGDEMMAGAGKSAEDVSKEIDRSFHEYIRTLQQAIDQVKSREQESWGEFLRALADTILPWMNSSVLLSILSGVGFKKLYRRCRGEPLTKPPLVTNPPLTEAPAYSTVEASPPPLLPPRRHHAQESPQILY